MIQSFRFKSDDLITIESQEKISQKITSLFFPIITKVIKKFSEKKKD